MGDAIRKNTCRGAVAVALAIALALATVAIPLSAHAERLEAFRGHLAFGYSQLFTKGAPGGSLAMGAGLAHPIAGPLAVGIDLGYHLLGSRAEEDGSQIAELDYSVFEALVLAHWSPSWPGPVGLVSGGPGFFSARADLTSSAPASFRELPVEETALGVALGASLIQKRATAVRVGFELATRVIFLPKDDWTLFGGRLVVHY